MTATDANGSMTASDLCCTRTFVAVGLHIKNLEYITQDLLIAPISVYGILLCAKQGCMTSDSLIKRLECNFRGDVLSFSSKAMPNKSLRKLPTVDVVRVLRNLTREKNVGATELILDDAFEKALMDYQLDDNLTARKGKVFLTGTQALVRLPLMQRQLDREQGLNTAGFISGYRGSPLGGYDQELWRSRQTLEANQIRFQPGVNEELAGTAVFGSQQVESDPHRTVDGVFAIWYGKGPGVDRAGDALKHGNVYGSSPTGGVLVVAGDDHGCVSSSMPHQSDFAMQGWGMPIVNPANVEEYLEFGLYGWALSRFSGMWVGFKAISETVESGATVDLDAVQTRFDRPVEYEVPASGLHYRWPDMPSLNIETRHAAKLRAVRAFARENSIDKIVCAAPHADVGIVTTGKAHLDLVEALQRLGLKLENLEQAGVRLYKVGLSFPLESTRMLAFKKGLKEIFVVEEKGPVVERQIKELFYNLAEMERPAIVGKLDRAGDACLSDVGELRPSRIAPVLAKWLAQHKPELDRRDKVQGLLPPDALSNAADAIRRMPYFCSGCPHSLSTKVPEGSRALAGIGCHFMASWMDRDTTGLTQMGGEGADWVAHAMFTTTKHVFQNLGDGTYFHSGFLAVRQAIAAGTNVTYKILFNSAVAMTGGQPIDGTLTVDTIAWQVSSEGAKAVAIVAEEIEKYAGQVHRFPAGTTFHAREELDKVQRTLRDINGVTVLIFDQACAAEKRRRWKTKEAVAPAKRMFINQSVCEGCGDCGAQSNCLSITPVETSFGRKRAIDQSSCNRDFSCADGFCPSFVSVVGGRLRSGNAVAGAFTALREAVDVLPRPKPHVWNGPFNLLVTGVGGTGVVTLGALISMAAHLERKSASVLDFMGFAQKGGSVLSFVRIDECSNGLNQARIDTQQADAMIACDTVVAASNDALHTIKHGHTKVVANSHMISTAAFVRNPDMSSHDDELMQKITHAAGERNVVTCNAQALTRRLFGDTIAANVLLLGFAWQRGLVPLSLEALERAIELNGVAVEANKTAFTAGRFLAFDPDSLKYLLDAPTPKPVAQGEQSLTEIIERRTTLLTQYQNAALAQMYLKFVTQVQAREMEIPEARSSFPLTRAVAISYAKLLAVKDEYEVARLFTNGEFAEQLKQQFEGEFHLQFHMAPPLLGWLLKLTGKSHKITFGSWLVVLLRLLAKAKAVRGTWFDIFGHFAERKMERRLVGEYEALIGQLLGKLRSDNHPVIVEIAQLPDKIRGYGHVKAKSIDAFHLKQKELLARLDGGDDKMSKVVTMFPQQSAMPINEERKVIQIRVETV
jgi:indolepyruvate ferredoxin oxidoreductase